MRPPASASAPAILLALDGSAFSLAALPTAIAIARVHGARLHLLTAYAPLVVPLLLPGAPVYSPVFDDAQRTLLQVSLEQAVVEAACAGIDATWTLADGDPVHAIVDAAEACDAVVVVMATHGRRGLARAWMGSVAESVMTRMIRPLLLLRPPTLDMPPERARAFVHTRSDDQAISAPSWGGMMEPRGAYGRVLVPVEEVALLEELLPVLAAFVRTGSAIRLVHVLDDASEHPWAPGIARAAAVLRAAGFGVETCALVGDPAARIAEQATMWGADLVAMSTHGRRGVARLAHRSVTQDVVRRVACPILVLRQRRETSRREASRRETSRREPLHACPGTDEAASYVR